MEFIEVGFISDAHGIKGEVHLYFHDSDQTWFAETKTILIGGESYEILKARPHKNGLLLVLEGVVDRNQAELLKGKKVEVPEDMLVSIEGDDIFLREVKGFHVFLLQETKPRGQIVGFAETKAHDLIRVETPESEVYEVPWVEDFIEKIDFDKEEVILSCTSELFSKGLQVT